MIKADGSRVVVQGDEARIVAEMGGVVCAVWRAVRQSTHDDQLALSMIVKQIGMCVDFEKISTTEIIEAIRTVEEIDHVHG